MFRFYNNPIKEEVLNQFANEVKADGIDVKNTDRILNVLQDKDLRKKLSKKYQVIPKNINNTSLIIYHGPFNNEWSVIKCISGYKTFEDYGIL